MAEALTIRVRRERDCPIVTVAGEIDIATVTQLRERLFELAAGGRPLIADLDQVELHRFRGPRGAGRRGHARRRPRRQPAGSLRPPAGPAAVPPDRAGPPDPAGPHLDGVLESLAAARDTPR